MTKTKLARKHVFGVSQTLAFVRWPSRGWISEPNTLKPNGPAVSVVADKYARQIIFSRSYIWQKLYHHSGIAGNNTYRPC